MYAYAGLVGFVLVAAGIALVFSVVCCISQGNSVCVGCCGALISLFDALFGVVLIVCCGVIWLACCRLWFG